MSLVFMWRLANGRGCVYRALPKCQNRWWYGPYKDVIEFLQKMKTENRFQADTWGVGVTKREEVLTKLVDKRYNQGAAWLEAYSE